jgi:hypothetical protein
MYFVTMTYTENNVEYTATIPGRAPVSYTYIYADGSEHDYGVEYDDDDDWDSPF